MEIDADDYDGDDRYSCCTFSTSKIEASENFLVGGGVSKPPKSGVMEDL